MVRCTSLLAYFLIQGSFDRHSLLVAASVKVFMLNPVGLLGGAIMEVFVGDRFDVKFPRAYLKL
jgi:hypothetical protein